MIQDARVLQPEFVPKDVVHRAHEINTLTSALDPITRDEQAETTLLYGPSGTGKTCIAKHTLEKLREEVLDINTKYVNCWEDYTKFKVLYRLLEGVDQTLDIHRQSTPRDELLDRLRNYDGPPYVVILDEVDQLEDTGVLYELYRTRGITMILIANRERELFQSLDSRLTSRLQTAVDIHFDPYAVDELVGILEDRVRWGLRDGVVTSDQLQWIADTTAGDARVAIEVLRVAARHANRQKLDSITDEVIAEAVPEAKSEIQQRNLEKLTEEQQILYDIIASNEEISPSELYKEYSKQSSNPKSDRMVRNYLQKMERYNLVNAVGENRGRTYRIVS